jgi:hypothetical protein
MLRIPMGILYTKLPKNIFKQKFTVGVETFFSMIFSYFSFLLLAFKFCQGRLPLKKYIKTYPKPSKSSLLAYSILKFDKTTLLPHVCIYASISRCSCEIFIISVWDVLSIFTDISFGQPKVN